MQLAVLQKPNCIATRIIQDKLLQCVCLTAALEKLFQDVAGKERRNPSSGWGEINTMKREHLQFVHPTSFLVLSAIQGTGSNL